MIFVVLGGVLALFSYWLRRKHLVRNNQVAPYRYQTDVRRSKLSGRGGF